MPDPLHVRARAALLDAVEALNDRRNALVLVGAQAVHLHTGDADLAVAEYTTDADFTVSPADLADAPLLADLLGARDFIPREHPGDWRSPMASKQTSWFVTPSLPLEGAALACRTASALLAAPRASRAPCLSERDEASGPSTPTTHE